MSNQQDLNTIFQGPPGTGKTYQTIRATVELIDGAFEGASPNQRFQQLKREGRIEFLTFHQSYSYENFVEGIRPEVNKEGDAHFAMCDGIFKRIATTAAYHCLEEIEEKAAPPFDFEDAWKKLCDEIDSNPTKVYEVEVMRRSYVLRVTDQGHIVGTDNSKDEEFTCNKEEAARLESLKKSSEALLSFCDAISITGDRTNAGFLAFTVNLLHERSYYAEGPTFAQLWEELTRKIEEGSINNLKIKNEAGIEMNIIPFLDSEKVTITSHRPHFSCHRKNALKIFELLKGRTSVDEDDTRNLMNTSRTHPLMGAIFNKLKDLELEQKKGSDVTHENSYEELLPVSYQEMHSTVQAYLMTGEASGYQLKPQQEWTSFALIIDEINRGNISKILGELITLLEPDKRLGAENELSVLLPNSRETFAVPGNLYLIGTMNTADKSIALLDGALRRRFNFKDMDPDFSICASLPNELSMIMEDINNRIMLRKDRDHRIGHAYFMQVYSEDSFDIVMQRKIIPLLAEYFYNDWEGLKFVLKEKENDQGLIRPIKGVTGMGRTRWQWYYDKGEDLSPAEVLLGNFSAEKQNGE